MNKFTVKINGEDYTRKAIYPLKWGDLLDERLDEATITLKYVKRQEPFEPLSEVVITLENSPKAKVFNTKAAVDGVTQTLNADGSLTQTMTKRFVVADDQADETPEKPEYYTHRLYIIEETKLLEGFICDSLQFQNALGTNFN